MTARSPTPPLQLAAVACAALLVAGCTSSDGLFGDDKVDYRSEAVKTRPLEVPPDLTQLARDTRYQVVTGGAVSAASAAAAPAPGPAGAAAGPAVAAGGPVAPGQLGNVRVERAGQQRWLVVRQQTPEELWPKLKSFWERTGFTLTLDNAQIGVMETNWSENRAKLPDDVVRNVIGRLARNLFDTGERDLFRTRLERAADGSIEIYVSHRGIEEVVGGPFRDQTSWRVRPSDPDLEAEMLGRLMVAIGSPSATAEPARQAAPQAVATAVGAVASAPQATARARSTSSGDRASLEVDDTFDRAWRRVGLVLDRGGFTVEDRDRAQGTYYVRYSDPKVAGQDEPNFFARVFGGAKDPQTPVRYRIVLKGAGAKTTVEVQQSDGNSATGENGQRIIARLVDDLK